MTMREFLTFLIFTLIFALFFKFDIHCEDSYKLALIGTVNNIGRALFLPLTGILSDKYDIVFEREFDLILIT